MKRAIIAAAGLVIGALAFWGVYALMASGSSPASLSGLVDPRGLSPTTDGSLLISEGGAGRLLKWDLKRTPEVLSNEFPHLAISGLQGESASGLSAAIQTAPNTYYGVVGGASAKGHSELYRLQPPGAPVPITGQEILGSHPPLPIDNPYDLVMADDGALLVTDSGRNAILRITPDGGLSDYALLGPIDVPGVGQVEAVPTGAVRGPDGAMYVTTLTGAPFPNGAALVYRIEDKNGDGDAMDPGEVTVYASGFDAATDLAFELDGSLLVTEFSTQMSELSKDLTRAKAAELPGRLVRRKPDGTTEVVADGLVGPTGVSIVDGRIFVSEEFGGRVTEVGVSPKASGSPLDWLERGLLALVGLAAVGYGVSRLLRKGSAPQ